MWEGGGGEKQTDRQTDSQTEEWGAGICVDVHACVRVCVVKRGEFI